MKKTNRRFLVYAVAIATSFAAVPGLAQAAPAEETPAADGAGRCREWALSNDDTALSHGLG